MAAGDTQVSIANQALLLLGADTIASFSNGTAVGNALDIIYPKVKTTTLGMYPWTFTLKKQSYLDYLLLRQHIFCINIRFHQT